MSIKLRDSNEYNAKELFDSRTTFKNEVYNFVTGKNQDILYNHFFENIYYGKLDKYNNSIFPSERFFKELNPRVTSFLFTHDFVAKSFAEMAEYYDRGYKLKKLDRNSPTLARLQPIGAFASMHKNFTNYLNTFNFALVEYVKQTKSGKNILTFTDYVDFFINFLKQQKGLIIFTRTKFIKSKLCPLSTAGFSISLSAQDHDNDVKKVNSFVSDANFPFYLECSRRYGFLVDKNAPWMLHFDFNSKRSQEQLTKFSLKDKDDVIDKRFYRSFFTDIKILKTFLHHSYTTYVLNDNVSSFVVDISDCNSPVIDAKEKQNIKLEDLDKRFDNKFWLKLYFDVRLTEEKIELQQAKYNNILFDTYNILRYGTATRRVETYDLALEYLNTTINSFIKFPSYDTLETF